MLFIGPTDTFLRYVGDVVPSLGEDQMMMATAADLGPPVTVTGRDADEVARIKGDVRMAAVLVRRAGLRATDQDHRPDRLRPVLPQARTGGGAQAGGAHPQAGWHPQRTGAAGARRGDRAPRRRLRTPGARRRGRRAPPARRGAQVPPGARPGGGAPCAIGSGPRSRPRPRSARLLASRARLRHATKDLFEPAEADLLHRPSSAGWTAADVSLLDELAVLLGRDEQDDGEASGRRASELAGASFQLVETALAEEMQAALENRTADCPRCQLDWPTVAPRTARSR
ncbi:MAG: hypothetical protein R2749_17860 [Acidimicrobiales bacterium]